MSETPNGDDVLEPFDDPAVADAFAAFDDGVRPRLLELRELVFATARAENVGPIRESLKWGQPSYVPAARRTGSPLRLGLIGGAAAVFFHCQTTLVDSFRREHGEDLRFEGNRAVIVGQRRRLPREALTDCIRAALTYRQRRTRGRET
jgi:hypothetical protein